jgi:hypothetical protein
MNIQVIADGADGFRLLAANNELLGWVRGRAIGVSGFADEAAAVKAAMRSYTKLAAWLERQHLRPLADLKDDEPRVEDDGAHRWVLVGNAHVARLTSGSPYDFDTPTHAFEIVLKGSITEGMTIHAALVALRAAHSTVDAADIARGGRRKPVGITSSVSPTTHREVDAW